MTRLSTSRLRRAEYVVVMSSALFVMSVVIISLFVGGEDVFNHLVGLDLAVLTGMLLLSLANYLSRAYRWHFFSKHIDVRVPAGRSVLYYFSGFAMTTTPGKVGETLRLWLIERCHGYGYERVAPLFLGDRLSDLHAMLGLCIVGLAGFSGYFWTTVIAAVLLVGLTILFVQPQALIAMVGATYGYFGHHKARLFAKGRKALRLTARLFTVRLFGGTLVLAMAGWFAECSAFYWLLQELGAPVSLQQATFIFAFSMVAGAISMLPGGLGGVEAGMLGLLIALGTELDVAVAATAIIRLTTLWFAVALGFLVLPVSLRLARRAHNPTAVTNSIVDP